MTAAFVVVVRVVISIPQAASASTVLSALSLSSQRMIGNLTLVSRTQCATK